MTAPTTTDTIVFNRGPARRPQPIHEESILQWSVGLPTITRSMYAGWLTQANRNDTLDQAMEAAGFSTITIRHSGGNSVPHWAISTATIFVIAEGVQSTQEMKHTNERHGISYAWRTLENGRQQSVLRCQVFLRELLSIGYAEPLTVSIKSTLTDDLLTALMRQYDVLDTIATFRRHAGKDELALPFYACSIPLGPGQEVARGTMQTKEIVPISAHIPTPITKDYIKTHWIKRDWASLIEDRLDETIAWSVRTSQQIAGSSEVLP